MRHAIKYPLVFIVLIAMSCKHQYEGPSILELYGSKVSGTKTWEHRYTSSTSNTVRVNDTAFGITAVTPNSIKVDILETPLHFSYYDFSGLKRYDTTQELHYSYFDLRHSYAELIYYYMKDSIYFVKRSGGNGGYQEHEFNTK